jgi:glycosyltransferase involved in cell wall biosynthesis
MTLGTRVALVHDYWVTMRGGERVFLGLRRLFPEADCFVLLRGPVELPADQEPVRLRSTRLQWLPLGARYFRALLPIYPLAARSLDLTGYDLVVSSSSGFCHGVRTAGVHICYCHTPLRYAWHEYEPTMARQRSRLGRAVLGGTLEYIRRWDYGAAQRVTAYAANSAAVQARIAMYYGRPSTIVHPFVDTARFRPGTAPSDYLLVVSQLLPYKRVDLAVAACSRLGRPLVVVGEGPERARLERLAGPSVTFLGRVDDERLARLYAGCAALLQCGEEDFGMAALEAQASGRPVIAYGVSGARETVVDGQTGLFFATQSLDAVEDALRHFEALRWDATIIRQHAEQFDEAHFRRAMLRFVATVRAESLATDARDRTLATITPGRPVRYS